MNRSTQTFALYFGNRGFFPESLIASARDEMRRALERAGYGALMLDADATRYGAVETPEEGAVYARFLQARRGDYDGVILCLPNFGDETGAVAALADAGVPILVQAYPDELDKMDNARRRDAYCGKFSVLDVFVQYGVDFSLMGPHVLHPCAPQFGALLDRFAAVCRVVRGMRRMVVGAIGARTSAFKTVRFDELTLQKRGITTETMDLSEVIARVNAVAQGDAAYRDKAACLRAYTGWDGVPEQAVDALVRLGVVLDGIIAELQLDALAIRCWLELEKQLGIAPCVLLSELNNRGMPAACELDVCNAVAMRALHLASARPAACLDWNNNYGEHADKCILFHCGPVAAELMQGPGRIVDHPMFAKALGPGHGFGCNTGRIAPTPMTFASAKTDGGALSFYVGEGSITADPVPEEFFGCAGVAEIAGLESVLRHVGENGYRHHVSISPGSVADVLLEAGRQYLGYEINAVGTAR